MPTFRLPIVHGPSLARLRECARFPKHALNYVTFGFVPETHMLKSRTLDDTMHVYVWKIRRLGNVVALMGTAFSVAGERRWFAVYDAERHVGTMALIDR